MNPEKLLVNIIVKALMSDKTIVTKTNVFGNIIFLWFLLILLAY